MRAIYIVLKDEFLRFLQTEEEWHIIANDYEERWQFPHVIGAMDGKHFLIDPPLQSGSMYYNYKGDYSVVLLALVDAHLRFVSIFVLRRCRH